jgi:fermentation-respiration switch protein FrsA (DUF1100 family)
VFQRFYDAQPGVVRIPGLEESSDGTWMICIECSHWALDGYIKGVVWRQRNFFPKLVRSSTPFIVTVLLDPESLFISARPRRCASCPPKLPPPSLTPSRTAPLMPFLPSSLDTRLVSFVLDAALGRLLVLAAVPGISELAAPVLVISSGADKGLQVFAGNLAYSTTDDGLKAFFAPVAADM